MSDSKLWAFLATFLSIIGFVLALILKKDDKYVMYYAKQSLMIFIVAVVVGILTQILMFIPLLGWLLMWVLNLAVTILWLISWIYALSDSMKPVPLVGETAENWFKNL